MQCEIIRGLNLMVLFVVWLIFHFQVGRMPMEWAKTVIPLFQSGNVKVRGRCIATPYSLQMMQEIMLLVRYNLVVPSDSSDEMNMLIEAFPFCYLFLCIHFGCLI